MSSLNNLANSLKGVSSSNKEKFDFLVNSLNNNSSFKENLNSYGNTNNDFTTQMSGLLDLGN